MTSLNYVLARKLLKTKSKKQNGFTLIELTVAIAVVGLVVASFAAGLRGLDDAKSRESAGQVAAAIQTATTVSTASPPGRRAILARPSADASTAVTV